MKNVERYRHIIPIIESFFATRGAVKFQYDGAGMKNSDFLDANARIVGEIKHSGEIGYKNQIKRFWKDWEDKAPIKGLIPGVSNEVTKGFVAVIYGQLFSQVKAQCFSKGWLVLEYPTRWQHDFDTACEYLRQNYLAIQTNKIVVCTQLEVGFYEFEFPCLSTSSSPNNDTASV